jgi:uncharacterized coiled-coil protein SlyX
MQEHSYVILRIPKNLHRCQNPTIMKKILLDTLTSVKASLRDSTTYPSSPRGLLLIPLILVCFALSPQMQALSPPPDGGYPNGNTAEGDSALSGLTGGFYNSAVGFLSLLSNADASFNTGLGAGTLLVNTASENTATGAGALLSNTIGDQNTADGAFALFNNSEGIRNTAIGDRALFNNTDDSNTAIGADALTTNTTGSLNVAVGGIALRDNEGNGNTAIGVGALFQATGNFNTAVGRLAGQSITTGNNIIAIGLQVDGVSTAFGEVDDSCYIDNIFGADVDLGTVTIVGVDADGKLGTNAVDAAGNRVPVASLLGGQHQAMLNRQVETLQATIAELKSTIAQQKNGMDALTAQLKEQAAQIQKVSTRLEVSKPAAQVVSYGQ